MNRFLLTFILIFSAGMSSSSFAQETLFGGSQHRVGFQYGYADQDLGAFELGVNYNYELHLFRLQYYRTLLSKETFSLELLFQPQYNIGRYAVEVDTAPNRDVWETGLNVGLLARKNFKDDLLSIYALISAGPHYVSGAPDRQVPGFTFSDNFMGGVNVRMFQQTYFDLRFGVRHVSNANLQYPNGGVNNFILNIGFFTNL